jgi:DNA-binding GntR family transcriptional regulator
MYQRKGEVVSTMNTSTHVPRASVADSVYERLRDEIMRGEIEDGSRISQLYLAERYGVSRIPVREALRRLQAESLVIATPHHPYVVRNVTAAQVLELVDARIALEMLVLTRGGRFDAATIAELRRINRQMEKSKDSEAFLALDRSFHRLIAGPESMIGEMINDIRNKIHKYITWIVDGRSGRATAAHEHTQIIDAFEADDRELAQQLMHDHLMKSREFIVAKLGNGNS